MSPGEAQQARTPPRRNTDSEERNQGRMARQDADLAALGRQRDFVAGHALEHRALRRDDRQREPSVQRQAPVFSFSAFSWASSIAPTLKNACSGSSSCLPSTISLKERIVSAIFT